MFKIYRNANAYLGSFNKVKRVGIIPTIRFIITGDAIVGGHGFSH